MTLGSSLRLVADYIYRRISGRARFGSAAPCSCHSARLVSFSTLLNWIEINNFGCGGGARCSARRAKQPNPAAVVTLNGHAQTDVGQRSAMQPSAFGQ